MIARTLPPIHAALVRAFLPGPSGQLRSIASKDWASPRCTGKRLTLQYDLPDHEARRRGFWRTSHAVDTADVGLPGATLADARASVAGDILTIDALVIFDGEPN
jgi:hypothetical protein